MNTPALRKGTHKISKPKIKLKSSLQNEMTKENTSYEIMQYSTCICHPWSLIEVRFNCSDISATLIEPCKH